MTLSCLDGLVNGILLGIRLGRQSAECRAQLSEGGKCCRTKLKAASLSLPPRIPDWQSSNTGTGPDTSSALDEEERIVRQAADMVVAEAVDTGIDSA